ncbi:T9SS type A sorting domain-containing protein [Labilibacter sediminis]|nr:T9SS type A sorting domain-containing protein [Labilibacter sediminis]
MKKLATLLLALFILSFGINAQSVSITSPTEGATLTTKSTTLIEWTRNPSGLPPTATQNVSFTVTPNYFGEIVIAADTSTVQFNSFVTTGEVDLIIKFRDDNTIADTVTVNITGEDQSEFYVDANGAETGWATQEDPIKYITRAVRYAGPDDKVYVAAGEYLVTEQTVAKASIDIIGDGSASTILKGNESLTAAEAVFNTNNPDNGLEADIGHRFLYSRDTSSVVNISGLTIQYFVFYGNGVGFNSNSHLNLNDIVVKECFGQGGIGAASVVDGNIHLTNCKFMNNTATHFTGRKSGGAVNISAGARSFLMDGCEISGTVLTCNAFNNGIPNLGDGAALHYAPSPNDALISDVTIKNCLIYNNQTQHIDETRLSTYKNGTCGGVNIGVGDMTSKTNGALFKINVFIENTTFSNNHGVTSGGLRLDTHNNNPKENIKYKVINCTLADNSAQKTGVNGAGGLFMSDGGMQVALINNLLLRNAANGSNDIAANNNFRTKFAVDTTQNNITEVINTNNLLNFTVENGNILDAVPATTLEGALADNGGPLMTYALITVSPAIDAGLASSPLATIPLTDGRTYNRDELPDVGAYEFDGTPTDIAPVDKDQIVFSTYPNPCDNWLYVNTGNVNKATIQIVTLSGRIVYSDISNQAIAKINVADLTPGMYVITITTNEGKGNRLVSIK